MSLYMTKGFCNVIKVKDLEIGTLPWIIWVGPISSDESLKLEKLPSVKRTSRQQEEASERSEKDSGAITGFENGSQDPRKVGHLQKLTMARKQILLVPPAAIYHCFHPLINSLLPSANKHPGVPSISFSKNLMTLVVQ